MSISDLYPHGITIPLYMTEFERAYELHLAASALCYIRNRWQIRNEIEKSGFTPEQAAGRFQILDIGMKLSIKERDEALDSFCAAWAEFRKNG